MKQRRKASRGFSGFFGVAVYAIASSAALAQTESAPPATDPPEQIIPLGVRTDARPMSYLDDTGTFRGYTVDLCGKIILMHEKITGKKFKIDWIPVTAASRFEFLSQGKVEAVCGATTMTLQRMETQQFTLMTFISGGSIMKLESTSIGLLGGNPQAKDDKEKATIGVVKGTTTTERVRAILGSSANIVTKDSHNEVFQLLLDKQIDYYLADRVILNARKARYKGEEKLVVAPNFFSYEPYAIPINPKNSELMRSANQALAELYQSGKIESIYKSWFGDEKMSPLLHAMYLLMRVPKD